MLLDSVTLNFREARVWVSTATGRQSVGGFLARPFTIHKIGDGQESLWVVSQMSTGRRIWCFSGLENAKEFCDRIHLIADWANVDFRERPGLRRVLGEIAEAVEPEEVEL